MGEIDENRRGRVPAMFGGIEDTAFIRVGDRTVRAVPADMSGDVA